MRYRAVWFVLAIGCSSEGGAEGARPPGGEADAGPAAQPLDPDGAETVPIDRFSEPAATLMVRSADNGLPQPDAPVDFDEMVTKGLGPDGRNVEYYNFDVRERSANPMYFFERADGTPVMDQLPVVDVIVGDDTYTDFWDQYRVRVPDDYTANTIVDVASLMATGFEFERLDRLLNAPLVPAGSSASRGVDGPPPLERAWYRGRVVHYLAFEDDLVPTTSRQGAPLAPVSTIFVTFNVNPDEAGGGPASGFVTEAGTEQTHNVLKTLPGDVGYSPLWMVVPYDNVAFDSVSDLTTAEAAPIVPGVASPYVNCPLAVVGG